MENNIFLTLYKYKPQPEMTPEENFFTESLRLVLEADSRLLAKFVKKIIGDHEFHAPFYLSSQERRGNSIIDLEVEDRDGRLIFIENKVKARQNHYHGENEDDEHDQVEKYLRMHKGYVCFIARNHPEIEIPSKLVDNYLGQFEWFQIYELIEEYSKKSELTEVQRYLITNFLNFMAELDMRPFQGFSQKNIDDCKTNFLDTYDKILEFLNHVYKDNRIAAFCKRNNLVAMRKTPKFIDGSFKLFLGKQAWGMHKMIEFNIYMYINESNSKNEDPTGLYYEQGVWCWPIKDYEDKFKAGTQNLKISSKFFKRTYENEWVLYKERSFAEMIKNGHGRAVSYIYDSLCELESSGVLKALDKIKIVR